MASSKQCKTCIASASTQVYERVAIEHHLSHAASMGQSPTDPVTNLSLPSTHLLPVYPMRSRAAEYRETTARACVEYATAAGCSEPVKYLRWAAELALPDITSSSKSNNSNGSSPRDVSSGSSTHSTAPSKSGTVIPGISSDFARFLATHKGDAYDALALKYFGNELLRAGCADAAADMFYRLLLNADDRQQQAEYLQLCLDCWTNGSRGMGHTNSSHGTETVGTISCSQSTEAQSTSGINTATRPSGGLCVDVAIVVKLANFVERQHCLSAGAIIDMLSGTQLGRGAALQLCDVLLSRAVAASTPGSPGSAFSSQAGVDWSKYSDLLVKYVQLSCAQVGEEMQSLSAKVELITKLSTMQPAPGKRDAADTMQPTPSVSQDASKPQSSHHRSSTRNGRHHHRGNKWRSVVLGRVGRSIATVTLVASNLSGGNNPWLRVARLVPLLLLLHSRKGLY